MKRLYKYSVSGKYVRIVVCLLAACIVGTACKKDDPAPEPVPEPEHYERHYVSLDKVTSSGSVDLIDRLLEQEWFKGLSKEYKDLAKASLRLILALSGLQDVELQSITYKSQAPDGTPISNATGLISVPYYKDPKDRKPLKGLIIDCHPTICSNREAPSVTQFSFGSILATQGYAVATADYYGFGGTASAPQAYLNARNTAQHCVDMARAAREKLKAEGWVFPADSAVYIFGYSQGGAAAFAVQKMIESNARDMKAFPIKRTFAGAGPYDPEGIFDYWLQHKKLYMPVAVPLAVLGLNSSENLNVDLSKVFAPQLYSRYEELILSKNYTEAEIDEILPENLDDLLLPEAQNKNNPSTARLIAAFRRNALVNWTPKQPVYMYASDMDDVVPSLNTHNAAASFQQQGCTNVEVEISDQGGEPYEGIHVLGGAIFIVKVFLKLWQ